MLKELLESAGITKEIRIAIYAICVTAVAMFFISDKLLFPERSAVTNQYKSDIDNLKVVNQKQEKRLEEFSSAVDERNLRINELSKEISRLQTYEQAIPEWRAALDNERTKSSNLQDQLIKVTQSSKDVKQSADSCYTDRDELKTNVSRLTQLVSSYAPIVDRTAEIRQLEKNKEAAELKLLELQDSMTKQFYPDKIEQLKRLSAEYNQQLLQLRQCSR